MKVYALSKEQIFRIKKHERKQVIEEVVEIIDRHIKEALEQEEDISMLCAAMADVEALKGGDKE